MTVFSKQDFLDQLNQLIPDNSTQRISPLDIRTAFTDLADSVTSFLIGTEIDAENIATPDTRTTFVGDFALGKMDLAGHSSVDNTAVGYYALGGNYNGYENTAVGSKALACNLYGRDNVGIGFDAVGHLVTGSGNVGVGNFTLLGNKTGSYNIAIGHGAGYYINPNDSYKFYVGSYGVTADDLCTVITSGAAPLLFGDLQNKILGIGVNALHAYGALQVNGNVTPSGDGLNSLGDPHARWNQIYASSGVGYLNDFNFALLTPFGGGYTQTVPITLGSDGIVYASGNLVPRRDGVFKLGDPTHKWDLYANDIVVSGRATINNLTYNTINECLYDCKTLHLATSGECSNGLVDSTVCGFMTDEGIDGGGLEIHSSGVGYRRDYRWIYKFPDQTLTHLEQDSQYSRSRWLSNISIAITGGSHLWTDRVLGGERLSLVTMSGGYGAFIRSNQYTPYSSKFFVGSEDHLESNYALLNETTNNTDPDIVFMGPSGNTKDFMFSVATPNSGLDIGYRLISRASGNWVGFGTEYHDDRSLTQDRLSTHVYNGQGGILEALTLLRNVHPSSGLFGITNIQPSSMCRRALSVKQEFLLLLPLRRPVWCCLETATTRRQVFNCGTTCQMTPIRVTVGLTTSFLALISFDHLVHLVLSQAFTRLLKRASQLSVVAVLPAKTHSRSIIEHQIVVRSPSSLKLQHQVLQRALERFTRSHLRATVRLWACTS